MRRFGFPLSPTQTSCAGDPDYRTVRLRLPSDVSAITAQDLYQHYGSDFRSRIDSVFTEDSDTGLSDRLRANVSRFAAYKAQYVQEAIKRCLNDDSMPLKEREQLARAVLHTFARYQDAERTTATARARTAKQFEQFMQPDNVRLFPNLKWLPSRSADIRTTHREFYNHIWAKDDAFWNFNAPGTEWNCKCDVEETDEPVTTDNPQGITKQEDALPGIEGNPAKTDEIFTDNASYIRWGKQFHTITQAIENYTYPDKQKGLSISVLADRVELHQNIRTGRILAKNGNDVVIMPHVRDGRKNPEYAINGEIADAKRIETEKGVTAGFKSALDQKCTVVIIDLNAHFVNRVPKWGELAKRINWRHTDLDDGVSCIVVYGNKSITITSNYQTKECIQKKLETLKP